MRPACREIERLVVSSRLRHPGNPVLTWCAANAVVERDGEPEGQPAQEDRREDRRHVALSMAMALGRVMGRVNQ
jgi:phage terminase large subunit-like protein